MRTFEYGLVTLVVGAAVIWGTVSLASMVKTSFEESAAMIAQAGEPIE